MSKMGWQKLNQFFYLLRKGRVSHLLRLFRSRLKSEHLAYGLMRDISLPFQSPRCLIEFSIREFSPEDDKYFFDDKSVDSSYTDLITTCYVGLNKEGVPCYRQWLIDSTQNEKIRMLWGEDFPQLKKDQALMESAFTIPKYRGLGIMPAIMSKIAEKARSKGVKEVITFVPVDNKNSIRSCVYAGFRPYALRRQKWFLFRKKVVFEEIPEALLTHYKSIIPRKFQ